MTDSGFAELKGVAWINYGSQNLKGKGIVRHSGIADLKGKANICLVSDLKGKAVVVHSVNGCYLRAGILCCPDLKGKAFIPQGLRDIKGKAVLRKSSTEEIKGIGIVRRSSSGDLKSVVLVRNGSHRDLKARGSIRHSDYRNLKGRAFIYHVGSRNLKGKAFLNYPPEEDVIVDDWIARDWMNYYECIGTGFISSPAVVDDGVVFASGINSFRITTLFQVNSYKEIMFGWTTGPSFNSCECRTAIMFSSFTEVDPLDRVVISGKMATFTSVPFSGLTDLYRDYGAGSFDGDYESRIQIRIDEISSTVPSLILWWLNEPEPENAVDGIYCKRLAGGGLRIYLYTADNYEHVYIDFTDLCSWSTDYWIKITRSGKVVRAYIYGDSLMTILIDTLQVTEHTLGSNLRILHAFSVQFYPGGSAWTASGMVKCLEIVSM